MQRKLNRLQLKDYRLVSEIAKSGQLAIAAESLGMTQPAASRMLAALEEHIGTRLFLRHPKGMTPTTVGSFLARNSDVLLRNHDQLVQDVESVISGRAGQVRVGSVTGGAVGCVVPAIQQLKANAPDAEVYVDVTSSDVLIAGLLNGDYDFVLSRIPPGIDPRQFSVRRGRVEVIHFLVRMDHPLASKEKLHPADLVDHEWVIQAPHTPMRQAVEEALMSKGTALPSGIVNTTSLLVMLAYLSSTNAIAPVTREVAELVAPAGSAERMVSLALEEPIIITPYHLISHKSKEMSPIAIRLRNLVLEKLSGGGDGVDSAYLPPSGQHAAKHLSSSNKSNQN